MAESELDPLTLRARLAEVITATPGVLRIEPTLAGSLRGVIGSAEAAGVMLTKRTAPDGTPQVRVRVDVATRAGESAREVAHRVRAAVAECLHDHGAVAGAVHVNVLSIEAGPG